MRRTLGNGYELDDDRSRIDLDAVWAYLTRSYWAEGRPRQVVEQSIRHSARVVGLYRDGMQVGFARVVSDLVTVAYLADVYVLEEHRVRGLGLELVREAVEGAALQGLKWLLHTRDAHDLYRKVGFDKPTDRLMERWPDGGRSLQGDRTT